MTIDNIAKYAQSISKVCYRFPRRVFIYNQRQSCELLSEVDRFVFVLNIYQIKYIYMVYFFFFLLLSSYFLMGVCMVSLIVIFNVAIWMVISIWCKNLCSIRWVKQILSEEILIGQPHLAFNAPDSVYSVAHFYCECRVIDPHIYTVSFLLPSRVSTHNFCCFFLSSFFFATIQTLCTLKSSSVSCKTYRK